MAATPTDDMILQLQSILGNIGTVLDAQLLVELKQAQIKAERAPELPWFLQVEKGATMTIGEPRVELPTDFLREHERSAYYVVNSAGKFLKLKKKALDDLRLDYEHAANGVPQYYDILGGYLWAYPKPDLAYSVRMHYFKQDTELATGDSGNLWSTYYPDLLVGLAGESAAASMRALDVKPRFTEMAQLAAQQLVTDNIARDMANLEESYGGG